MAAYSFNFTVDGNAIPAIQGGNCSAPLNESAGQHKIVELPTTGFKVTHISALPASAKVSANLSTGHSTIKVTAGAESVVTYTNQIKPAELKICKQAASDSTQLIGQPFSFSVNGGSPFTLNAGPFGSPNCSGLTTYAAGTNVTVTELQPKSGVHVNGIDVTSPPATNVHTDLNLRTASLTVGSGVNIVTYTNQLDVSAQPGYLEICKDASDPFVSGNFSFTITDAAGNHYSQTVRVGQCSGPFAVTAGAATITEASSFPYFLDNVTTNPSDRLISSNLSNGTATVSVVAGNQSTETMVHFVNDTESGLVKVCKTLSSNSNALTGSTFTFPYTSSAGNGTVSVVAGAPGQTACTIIAGPLNGGFPLGTAVSINENSTANVSLTGVSVSPASADNGSTSTTANLTVGSGVTIATFNNEAMGTLEICKDAADNQTLGQPFTFSVNGGAPITVNAGQCSPAISVPAGTATISEGSSTNFHLVTVTATGPDGSNRLVSGFNPVTVSVPFGGVSNETLVTFTNAVNTGQFKICKTTTATADGSGILLGGDTFNYSWYYTVDGTYYSSQTSLTLPVNGQPGVTVCSGLIGPIPVQQSLSSGGGSEAVTLYEIAYPGTYVLSTTYAGGGSGTNCSGSSASPCSVITTITLGQGINIETFDNEPTPPAQPEATMRRI